MTTTVRAQALSLGGVLVAQAVLVGWPVWRSWFFVDDFLFLRQGMDNDLSVAYLRLSLFEHFSPMHRLVSFLFVRAFGLSWTAGALLLIALSLACTLALAYVLAAVVREWRTVIAGCAAFGCSFFMVRNAVWWTGGVHVLLLTTFSLVTLGGFARWHLRRSVVSLVISFVSYSLALLTHENGMLIPGFLLALRLLVLPPPVGSFGAVAREIWRDRAVWVGYLFLTALSAANFVANYYQRSERPPLADFLRYLWAATAEGFFATLLLIKVPEAMVGNRFLTGAIALAVVAAFTGATLRTRRGSWKPWLFFFTGFALTVVPLGINRVSMFGPGIGREPRYQTGPAYLFVIAACAVLDLPRRQHVAPVSRALPRVLGPTAVAVGLVLFLRGGGDVADQPEARAARTYIEQFRRDAGEVRAEKGTLSVFDGIVPAEVVPEWLAPYNRFGFVLDLAEPQVRFGEGDATATVLGSGHLAVARADSAASAEGSCAANQAGTRTLGVQATPPAAGTQLVVRIEYYAPTADDAQLVFVTADGASLPEVAHLPAGDRVAFAFAPLRSLARAQVRVNGELTCLRSVSIAAVVPVG